MKVQFDPQVYLAQVNSLAESAKDYLDRRVSELRAELERAAEAAAEFAGETDNLKLVEKASHILLGEIPEHSGPIDEIMLDVRNRRVRLSSINFERLNLDDSKPHRVLVFILPTQS